MNLFSLTSQIFMIYDCVSQISNKGSYNYGCTVILNKCISLYWPAGWLSRWMDGVTEGYLDKLAICKDFISSWHPVEGTD